MEPQPSAKSKKLWIVVVVLILLLLVTVSVINLSNKKQKKQACTAENKCEYLTQTSWQINFQNKSVQRIKKENAPEPFFVRPSGRENTRLEIRDSNNELVYERDIFVDTNHYYDYIDKNGKLTGGVKPAKDMIITSFLPWDTLPTDKSLQLVLISKKDNTVIAKGML